MTTTIWRGLAAGRAALGPAQKSGHGAPPYSRWVNRPLGRIIAGLALNTRITPDQLTGLSGLITLSGVVLLAAMAPSHTVALVITALLVLGYAVDAADGQLARARGTSSPSGEWLDHMVDAAKVCLLHSAVLVSFYRFPRAESDFWLLVPLGYTTIASVFFFGFILTDQLRRRIGTAPAGPAVTEDAVTMRSGLLQTVVATPSDYGLLCLAFALYGWPLGFLAAYTALCAANGVLLIAVLGRWHRQLRAADAGTRVGA